MFAIQSFIHFYLCFPSFLTLRLYNFTVFFGESIEDQRFEEKFCILEIHKLKFNGPNSWAIHNDGILMDFGLSLESGRYRLKMRNSPLLRRVLYLCFFKGFDPMGFTIFHHLWNIL